MGDVQTFGAVIGVVCVVVLLAVLSNRAGERLGVPAPAFFLVAAAVAAALLPQLAPSSITSVQRVVTVALLVILFNGGMDLGWERFRRDAAAIVWLGAAGTLVTAAAVAAVTHVVFGIGWRVALLIGTALSPTDPAVVFSVLGRREIAGRSGTLLEGESGANDPVGIALMVSLLSAGAVGGAAAVRTGVLEFVLQLGVGAVVGLAGGRLLVWSMRHVALPSEGLYPIRVLAFAGSIYALATLAQGSGFLAVFVAGIVVGDVRAPYKREVERFHSALASLGEIVAFAALGLTVQIRSVASGNVWVVGLVLGALLAFVIRPALVGLVLWPVRLARAERVFVLWAGLKGAVPVLLGTYILSAGLPGSLRAYDIVVVVVLFSVLVSGGLVPVVAAGLRLPVHTVEPEPWALGLRLRDEPHGVHRVRVGEGSAADGASIDSLGLASTVWVSLVERAGGLVHVRGDTVLLAGDTVLLLAQGQDVDDIARVFAAGAAGE